MLYTEQIENIFMVSERKAKKNKIFFLHVKKVTLCKSKLTLLIDYNLPLTIVWTAHFGYAKRSRLHGLASWIPTVWELHE